MLAALLKGDSECAENGHMTSRREVNPCVDLSGHQNQGESCLESS